MRFHPSDVFEPAFDHLLKLASPRQRGHEFEGLIAQILSSEHFDVQRKSLRSNRRQVDLFATLGRLNVLLETKWTSRPAGVNEVDQLRTRLETAAPHTIGVLISMSDFTTGAIQRVAEQSARPMVLINRREVESCIEGRQRLRSLIVNKSAHLSRNQEVVFDDAPVPSATTEGELPPPAITLVTANGTSHPTWEGAGGYDPLVFVLHHADVDWSAGTGVGASIDLDLEVEDQSELIGVISLLHRLGWITPEGSWRINQSVATWNGFGAGLLVEQLLDWQHRYQNRAMHHTEEVIYTDVCEYGMFTMTADISAHHHRRVTRTRLSFQLSGVPLDTSPFETLAAAFRVWAPPVFRVRTGDVIQSKHLPKPKRAVSAVAYLVREHRGFENETETWVEGVVCEDPFASMSRASRTKAGLPAESLGHVAMWLRSSHRLGDERRYAAYGVQSAWTSEAEVTRFMGDWVD